jgi:hypothetical protein
MDIVNAPAVLVSLQSPTLLARALRHYAQRWQNQHGHRLEHSLVVAERDGMRLLRRESLATVLIDFLLPTVRYGGYTPICRTAV